MTHDFLKALSPPPKMWGEDTNLVPDMDSEGREDLHFLKHPWMLNFLFVS